MSNKKIVMIISCICFVVSVVVGIKLYTNYKLEIEPAWSHIKLNEEELTFPFSYAELKKAGFYVDKEDEKVIYEPRTMLFGSVDLKHKYEEYYIKANASFRNPDQEQEKRILECEILYFELLVGSTEIDHPTITIADKIELGSTEEEITKVLGKPSKGNRRFEEDNGYTQLTYETSYSTIILSLDLDKGLYGVTIGTN